MGGKLWQHRDFRSLWIGKTTSVLGTTVSEVAIPLLAVFSLHASAFDIGALTAIGWLPWLVICLPVGALVDRLRRRPVLIAADLVTAVALVSIPVAAWSDGLTYAHLFLAALVIGIARVFSATAFRAYLPSLVAKPDLAEANGKLQGSEAFAVVAGPGLAGVLSQWVGVVTGLLVDAVSCLVSAVCLLRVRTKEPRREPVEKTSTLRKEIATGLRLAVRDPYLRTLALAGAASNLWLNVLQAILTLFLIREIGVNAAGVGTVLAVMGVGGLAGALVANRLGRRLGTARALLLVEVGAPPFGLLIAFAGPGAGVVSAVLGGFLLIGGIVVANVLSGGFNQAYCPQELLGRISASMQFVNYGAIPIGALLGGILGDSIGLRPTMVVAVIGATLAGSILLTGPIRRHRDLPTEMAVPEPALAR